MTVCLLVIDDGRENYLELALNSARQFLPVESMPFVLIRDDDHELGFGGAVQAGWQRALATGADHVYHLESDFVHNRPIPLDAMAALLADHPHIVQVALLRQPWSREEHAAGGIVAMHPDAYTARSAGPVAWLEHRRNVTTNPSLWPRWVIERGWPQCTRSEEAFGTDLFASDPLLQAAYWGHGQQWVTHIGTVRTGTGY